MAIDRNKLQNIVKNTDGSYTARCPACAASGADSKSEHLIVFPDGRFGCVAHPKDKDHNKAVLLLAGDGTNNKAGSYIPKLEIRPQKIESSKRLLLVGSLLGRAGHDFSTAPEQCAASSASVEGAAKKVAAPKAKTGGKKASGAGAVAQHGRGVTMEEARAFLGITS